MYIMLSCTEEPCIPVRELTCTNPFGAQICLPAIQECDGHDDCGDGLDEIDCGE